MRLSSLLLVVTGLGVAGGSVYYVQDILQAQALRNTAQDEESATIGVLVAGRDITFGQAIERLLPGARYVELEPFHEEEDEPFEQVLTWAREADQIVVATVVRPAAWHAFGLAARERRFVQTLLAMDKPATLAVLGGARGLAGMEGYDTAIVTGSDVPASQVALAEVLAGRTA